MTKASTHLIPDFKIRVTDEAHSRAIQEELFRRGAKWFSGGDEVIHTESEALYLSWWGITHAPEAGRVFEGAPMPEHTFTSGKFSFDKEEEAKPDADGWIEWKGGECPVGDGVAVEYRLSDGQEMQTRHPQHRCWKHFVDSSSNIIAYRIHKPKSDSANTPAQEQPTIRPKKEWQQDRLLDVLQEMTRLVKQADYDTVYDLLTDEAAQLINDLKWKK